MVVTVQLLPINVVLATNPVALGVDDVPPLRFIVLLLYAVVPFVPSNAAKDTNMPSTDAWLRAIPVIIKLPPNLFNVDPNENVTKFGAVIVNGLVELTVINAGKDSVVNIAKVIIILVPPAPLKVANDEKSADVAAGPINETAAGSVVNDGKLYAVTAVKVGVNALVVTVVNDEKFMDVADGNDGKNPLIVVKPEKLTLVAAGADILNRPVLVIKLLMLKDERIVKVPDNPATEVNDEKLRLVAAAPFNVSDAAAVMELNAQEVNDAKLNDIPTPLPPVKEGKLTDVATAQLKLNDDVTVVQLGNDNDVNDAALILKLVPALTNEDKVKDVNPANVNCSPPPAVTKLAKDKDPSPLDDKVNDDDVEDNELKSTLLKEFAVNEKPVREVIDGN